MPIVANVKQRLFSERFSDVNDKFLDHFYTTVDQLFQNYSDFNGAVSKAHSLELKSHHDLFELKKLQAQTSNLEDRQNIISQELE